MTINNGPPNYKSLAGTYTLGSGTTLTINSADCDPIEINKYDIPVGALVFVKTKNLYSSFFTTAGWSQHVPTITWPRTSISPTWIVNPSVSKPYTGGITVGGGTTTPAGLPYVVDSGTGTEIELDVDTEIEDSLRELYYDYYTADVTNGGTGGFGLGMATMGGLPKKSKKKAKKSKKAKQQVAKPGTYVGGNNGLTSGQITINSNFGITRPPLPEYQVKGHKTISDYMSGQNPVHVIQQEGLTEDELYKIFDEKHKYPEIGKPFHGIVVDRFVPRVITEQGEVVDLPHQRLYKVLINETNCLWVEESELAPMKPEDCPIKEGFEKEETDND